MSFNVNEISSSLATYGVMRDNRFTVTIPAPPILSNTNLTIAGSSTAIGAAANLVTYRADSVTLPGMVFATIDQNRYGVGSLSKMPYNSLFQDNRISFIADGEGLLYGFFFSWLNAIYNFAAISSDAATSTPQFNTPYGRYNLAYKKSSLDGSTQGYTVDMQVTMYSTNTQPILTLMMFDAFPTTLNDNRLDWGSVNNLFRVIVDFSFRDWTIVNTANNALNVPSTAALT